MGSGNSGFGVRLIDTTGKPVELQDLSQDRLKLLLISVSETRKRKYKRRNEKKYGSLNKGFTEEEHNKLFKFCYNSKAYLCFFLMANLGLRVGEVIFDTTLVKMKVDVESAEKVWKKALKMLGEDCPKTSCEWCEGK